MKIKITIEIEKELLLKVDKAASNDCRSRNSYIIKLLTEKTNEEENGKQ